ncbi:D-hydantoinase [Rubrobacter xylanophilus]|uniref:D-hydantoinase n=1 Tax=Rubrobacter xylanophilus TaxID=49319 RepID=A0A510HJ75_9ACTN|nr:dihydropyrimidinase [Rubrobacter xylanophilus]BBL80051.1 D-hydantoinase [Rubrobacter xylanophilus]
MSVLIKGGRIITAADDYVGDIFIEGETVSLIGRSLDVRAEKVIDASGRYVIPGCIDPHTHMEMPFGGTVSCDDFTSGTISAAFGGTTTIVDFCLQQAGQTLPEALETWHEKIERAKPVIDVGFHLAVTDLQEKGTLEDLAKAPEEGVTSYKLFMAYKGAIMVDDETLFKVMQVASETGALVMVHAEHGDSIDVLVKQALAEGKTEPKWHAATRPPITEGEATNRAVQLAHLAGAPLYVVHVSCKEAIDPIARAREADWRAWGETCTQYLFIDESYLDRPGFEGAKYVYTPPPRPKENQEHLWHALSTGVLSVISTDHCPFRFDGQKTLGKDDFSKIPNGGPGVEDRLMMIHNFGVREGRISLNRMVELLSTAPARFFGLYPRKGTIAVGSDADLVVFDPNRKKTISAETHHSNIDYNLYEGTEVTGVPETVLLRGQVLVENGELVAIPGAGRFVRRARFGEELPGAAGERPIQVG